MEKQKEKLSKTYLYVIVLLMLVFPLASMIIEAKGYISIPLMGKWFGFWAIGVRLFTAGLKQVLQPAFTARDIFHIKDEKSYIIVRELGFANICLGLVGIISLFIPEWRMAAAFTGGLYMGMAGIMHIIKKPSTPNEVMALISDVFIFLLMAVYIISIF